MEFPSVSVVMPVRNEAAKIKSCIEGILSQSVPVLEIIVVDSNSTDGTIEILKSFEKVKVVEIKPQEFNHGLTRNLGVSYAKGEFVILTVGDARPADNNWIKNLLEGFDEPCVAGVCGQQVIPHERDKNPAQWFRPLSPPGKTKYYYPNSEIFHQLLPQEKKNACGWDDVTAMYRKDILQKIPFQKTSFAEDLLWSRDALLSGYSIVYNTAARVYHYHNETPDFTFRRTLTELYYRYKVFGVVPTKPVFKIRKQLTNIRLLFKAKISFNERWKWFKYNITLQMSDKKAVNTFLDALNRGEEYLDVLHEKLCGIPPTPGKKIINNQSLIH